MTSCLSCPVTALRCHHEFLLTGQKSILIVFSTETGKKLYKEKVFNTSSIHNICVLNDDRMLVIGGRSARIIQLEKTNECASFKCVTKEKLFSGWLWNGIWISETKYALITAHNTVLVWDSTTNEHQVISSCEEQCILYSAVIEKVNEELVVAAGTVFNQVLLWKPCMQLSTSHQFQKPWKRFHGHEGVIFRIRFNDNFTHLLSVSDDRSIRIWDIETEECLNVLFGHAARVWDAILTKDNLVSVGEDATCVVWSKDGDKILKKFTGHKGKSIWSLDTNESHVFTGGGDGAIRRWPLKNDTTKTSPFHGIVAGEYELPVTLQERSERFEKDFPRIVKVLDHDRILLFTNNGLLLTFEDGSETWKIVHEDARFYSYCVLGVDGDIVIFGNLYGMLKVMSLENRFEVITDNAFNGKIFSLVLKRQQMRLLLLITGPEGEMKLYEIDSEREKLILLSTFVLPHSKQRWVTDFLVVCDGEKSAENENISLLCGDRRGSLHLFKTFKQDPVHSILGVHGKTGVTSIVNHNGVVYSTGRDGNFRKYTIKNDEIVLIDKQKVCKGLDWIEGLWFHNDDIMVYGFYMQSHFALWSFYGNDILFKVQCGGGYRSWDIKFSEKDTDKLHFAYLKGPLLHTVTSNSMSSESGAIIQAKLHGKEILCAKILGRKKTQNNTQWLIATSSEDTTINFLTYDSNNQTLRSIHTAGGHIGGVKDIVFVPYRSTKYKGLKGLFVSCGSRTSLKIWELTCEPFVPYSGSEGHGDKGAVSHGNTGTYITSISCCLLHEIFNPEMNPKQLKLRTGELIDDMRYLCCDAIVLAEILALEEHNEMMLKTVCCVTACSDGVARVYMFREHNSPHLLVKLGDKKHCVQQVRFAICAGEVMIFSTSTNGVCTMWDIHSILHEYVGFDHNNSNTKPCAISTHVNNTKYKFHEHDEPIFQCPIPALKISGHQSGINTLDFVRTSTGILLATGGDDNALNVTYLSKDNQTLKYHVTENFQQTAAHISSITGVYFINEHLLISTSIDQRIKFWDVNNFNEPVKNVFTDIADVSNLEVWNDQNLIFVAVTGIGMEILTFSMEEILKKLKS